MNRIIEDLLKTHIGKDVSLEELEETHLLLKNLKMVRIFYLFLQLDVVKVFA
jgi:hypothetical protein